MRILADENFPRPIVESLRKRHQHDVLWARTDCPGLKDRTLLERAEAEGRIVLTLDKDFWQIALQRPIPLKRCGVILFRVFSAIPETLEPLVDSTLRAGQSWLGHVSIVTHDGIEMFPTGGLKS
jgi:predicted nuclease of predicted toxin-antitoxin system